MGEKREREEIRSINFENVKKRVREREREREKRQVKKSNEGRLRNGWKRVRVSREKCEIEIQIKNTQREIIKLIMFYNETHVHVCVVSSRALERTYYVLVRRDEGDLTPLYTHTQL